MEKTFEELIEQKLTATTDGYVVYTDDIKDLLKQVREATITECIVQVLTSEQMIDKMYGLSHLPTDRIKLTDK